MNGEMSGFFKSEVRISEIVLCRFKYEDLNTGSFGNFDGNGFYSAVITLRLLDDLVFDCNGDAHYVLPGVFRKKTVDIRRKKIAGDFQ